jgi:hypothetical protein
MMAVRSAKSCAASSVKTLATAEELGTGKSFHTFPTEGAFKPEAADESEQELLMKNIASKLVQSTVS